MFQIAALRVIVARLKTVLHIATWASVQRVKNHVYSNMTMRRMNNERLDDIF